MAREAIGRTYGLPIFFTLKKGEKAIIGRLLSCNYLVTVARDSPPPRLLDDPSYILAFSLNDDESRRHPQPLLITESSGFTLYNEDQTRLFEVQAPVSQMVVSIIPVFVTNPPADLAGPTTVPDITISPI